MRSGLMDVIMSKVRVGSALVPLWQVWLAVGIIGFSLVACGPAATATPQPTATQEAAEGSDDSAAFPLAEPGPYRIGKRTVTYEDASRAGRQVTVTVWYPAVWPEDLAGGVRQACTDCDPDRGGAPYPLILSSSKMARDLAPYLISHGFAWASVNGIDTYEKVNEQAIDQPRDLLFALEQVAASPPEGLEGVIDAEQAGAIGYSFDGYNALALSGARIDAEYYLAQCPDPDPTTEAILGELSAFDCGPAEAWDQFAAHAGEAITASEDGLWQPMTDRRIRAVMPLAGEGWWLFGERGLAAVDRPVLMMAGTRDELYPENALIFDHLGTADKALISFVGRGHMMILADDPVAQMAHFAAAFFGTHLQGRGEYAHYWSEAFVSGQDGLAWGVYAGD